MSQPDSLTDEWMKNVVAVLRDVADKIERGELAASRFNMRAPVVFTGIKDGCATYEIGDKRSMFVETVMPKPAPEKREGESNG